VHILFLSGLLRAFYPLLFAAPTTMRFTSLHSDKFSPDEQATSRKRKTSKNELAT